MNAICIRTGKRIYKRHQEADRIVGLARKQGKGLACVPVSSYRCAACKKWHVSSMTQFEHQVRQLMREVA